METATRRGAVRFRGNGKGKTQGTAKKKGVKNVQDMQDSGRIWACSENLEI